MTGKNYEVTIKVCVSDVEDIKEAIEEVENLNWLDEKRIDWPTFERVEDVTDDGQ